MKSNEKKSESHFFIKPLILFILTSAYFIFQRMFSVVFINFFAVFPLLLGYSLASLPEVESSDIIFIIIIYLFIRIFLLTPFIVMYFLGYFSGKILKKINKFLLNFIILIMLLYFLYNFNYSSKTHIKGNFFPVIFHITFSIGLIFGRKNKTKLKIKSEKEVK